MKLLPNSCLDCRFLIVESAFLPDGVEAEHDYCTIWRRVIEFPGYSQCQCGIIRREVEDD